MFSHGKVAFERGDAQSAYDAFVEAHRIASIVGVPDASMAQLLNNLTLCAQRLDKWREATDYCERCLRIRENFQLKTHTEYLKYV